MNKKLLLPCLAVGASLFTGQILTNNVNALDAGLGASRKSITITAVLTGSIEEPISGKKYLSIIEDEDDEGKLITECSDAESANICKKVEFDEKNNTLTLNNLGSDKDAPFYLTISFLDNLTIKLVGENNLIIFSTSTDIVLDGEGTMNCSVNADLGILSTSCIESDGKILFKNGTYNLSHYRYPVISKEYYDAESNYKPAERILLGENMELKGQSKEAKLAHSSNNVFLNTFVDKELFALIYSNEEMSVMTPANEIHIAPKENKQPIITPASAKTEESPKNNSETTPNTGHFQQELSVTLASILGTAIIVTASALLLVLAKKKSKKEINYF